jgi:hypothetical protein
MRLARLPSLSLAALLTLAGCQSPDVGQKCTFTLAGVDTTAAAADYLETGPLTDCETLICIVSPPTTRLKNNPYCSKPCVSNSDCSQDETGLVCRSVVLDPAFLASLDESTRNRYLGQFLNSSTYCAAPLE